MNVGRYMHSDPVTVSTVTSLAQVKEVMEEKGFSLLLIVDEEKNLVGFITRGALKGVTDWDAPVGKACFKARFAVSTKDTLEKAALILIDNQLVLLPVVEEGKLVGVLSQSEILRALARALGIGLEGIRITVKVPQEASDQSVYQLLQILNKQGVRLISLSRGGETERYREVILRVQGVEDKEGLRAELEAVLRDHHADNQHQDNQTN